jgi:hypothetical protein
MTICRPHYLLLLLLSIEGCQVGERNKPSPDVELVQANLTADAPNAIGNIGNGLQTFRVTGVSNVATQSDIDALTARKAAIPAPPAAGASNPGGPTAETLAWAAQKDPGEPVHFTLVLPERPFSWDRFRGATDANRASLVQDRQTDVATVQSAIISRLSALGGQEIEGLWVANVINVTLPAGVAPQMASWSEIALLEHDAPIRPSGTPGDGLYGADRRVAIHADRLLAHGFTGVIGNAATPSAPVKIGAVGAATDAAGHNNLVPSHHPGFEDAGLHTRFENNVTCQPTVQSCSPALGPNAQTHDTTVMGVLGGSIEAGQDSSMPGTSTPAQVDRSGIATGATLEYFHAGANSTQALAIGVQAALNVGIDIVNNSWGVSTWMTTDPTTDLSGLNEILQNAFNAGVLVVFAAGDSNGPMYSTSCNVSYPANRPDVLTINGSNTAYSSGGLPPSAPVLLAGAWATSGCTIDVATGPSTYTAARDYAIGGVAPGLVGLSYFWDSPSFFGYSGNGIGSSFAAPAVAGAAALLRNAWQSLGYGIRPNYFLKTDLMMLTDGYNFTSYSDGGTARRIGGTSPYSGTGRLQLRTPIYDFPSGAWQWSWTNLNIGNGSTWSKTVPVNIQNYRFAMFWEETDLTHVADIDVRIDALNSAGAVCAGSVAAQNDYSIVNAIHLIRSDIPACALSGGSLQLTITGFAVPSGQTRFVYFSDLWDNEVGY